MDRRTGKMVMRLLVLVAIIAVVLGVFVVLFRSQIKKYESQITDLKYNIESTKKYVYVASTDIEAGDEVKMDDNIMSQQIASGIDASLYITSEELVLDNFTALVDIPAGQPIMKNMITSDEITKGSMEVEINVATLLVDSATNDYVDVRIAFADGSDYIVLAKKQMKNLIYDTSTWYTDLNEQEILTLTSAITDAYTNTGTYIYLTRYTNPTVQESNVCTYPVNGIVHDIVNGSGSTQDENVDRTSATYLRMTETLNLVARQRLEDKLSSLTPEQLAAVAAGRQIEDTASATAYAAYEESLSTSAEYADTVESDVRSSEEVEAETDAAKAAQEAETKEAETKEAGTDD